MAAKSNHNKSIIPLSFFVAVGAIMAFAILLQSPSLAFADDSTKGVKDVTQTDAPEIAPAPVPQMTSKAQHPWPQPQHLPPPQRASREEAPLPTA